MSLFSSSSSKAQPQETIPLEIRQAVTIMGEATSVSVVNTKPVGNSPFLEEGASLPAPPVAPTLKPLFEEGKKKDATKKKFYLWGALSALIVALLAGLLWYILGPSNSMEVSVDPEPVQPEVTIRVDTPVTVPAPAPAPPFSLTGPNYLSIDTEVVTPASFQALLAEKKQILLNAGIIQPVEFLLTDKNNNPLAFSRVAYLMNIELSPGFLATIAESFSLFLYNDQGKVMPALALTFGTVDGPTLFAKEREGSFPYAFRSFLYEGMTVPRDVIFRTGVYKEQPVRYVNIDEATQTSFDYALRGTTWMIGTTKETLRAILDVKF